MNRTWNSESKRYTERMYRKYEMSLEEAFDKQAFEEDPVGYFKSIDYKITGLDWIPAMWNLVKLAWSDYTPSKYASTGSKFGPKGQKAIAIMRQVINNNPKLKSRVERLQAKAPKNEKQVEAEISELMGELKESNRSSYNRLEEGFGTKAKIATLIALIAFLTTTTIAGRNVMKADAESRAQRQIFQWDVSKNATSKTAEEIPSSVKDVVKEPTIEDVKNLIAEAIKVYEGKASSSISKAEMEEIQQIMKGFGAHIKYAAYGFERDTAEKAVRVACENVGEAEVIDALKPYLS